MTRILLTLKVSKVLMKIHTFSNRGIGAKKSQGQVIQYHNPMFALFSDLHTHIQNPANCILKKKLYPEGVRLGQETHTKSMIMET